MEYTNGMFISIKRQRLQRCTKEISTYINIHTT